MADIIVDSEFRRKQKDGSYKIYHPITKGKNVKVTVPGVVGTEVETVLKNLFQFASNGKNKVATAITGKGVNASSSDSFDILANKIGQINTGKKWAKINIDTFTVKDFKNNMGQRPIPTETAKIRGLNFKPSVILFHWKLEKLSYDVISLSHVYTNNPYVKDYEHIVNRDFPNGGLTDLTAINASSNGFDCAFNINSSETLPYQYRDEKDMVVTEVYCIAYE